MTPRPPPKRGDHETSRERLKRAIRRRGLRGLANDTKWREFIAELPAAVASVPVGAGPPWPRFRSKDVYGELRLNWDSDIWHVKAALHSFEWLDIDRLHHDRRLPPTVTDFGPVLIALLERVGLEFEAGRTVIRVFGYAPKSMEHFDE